MKKTQSLKFLALSLVLGVAGIFATAWANYDVTLDGSTLFDDGGLKYKITSLNKSTYEATVEVSGNVLDPDADEIPFPENGTFERNVKGKYNGATINHKVKFTVTAIGSEAFADLKKVKTIDIPGTVETIADDAFNNCGFMATMTFGEGSKLKTLGDGIFGVSNVAYIDFSNCKNLDLSTGTPFIPRNGSVNNQLKAVKLPKEIKNLGVAFKNCPKLAWVNTEGEPEFNSKGEIATDNGLIDLYQTNVTNFDGDALKGDAGLKKLVLPWVKGEFLKIGNEAFCGTNITELTIYTDLNGSSLSAYSFAGIQLVKVVFKGELLGTGSIPTDVFAKECDNKFSKNSLTTLIFEGDILAENAIATGAVKGLTKLATLEFGNISKNGIAASAFTDNTKPANIKFHGVLGENAIGATAFLNSYLASVEFDQDINTAAIGQGAFKSTKCNVIKVPVTFKGRLTAPAAIGEDAFAGSQVGEIYFEKEIISENAIAKNAFANTKVVTLIDFQGDITKKNAIDELAFTGTGNNATLKVANITASQAINSTAFKGSKIQIALYANVNATEAIAPSQFEDVTSLNQLTIESDLTYVNTIGANAFKNTSLTGILLKGDITVENAICASSVEASPFYNAGKNAKLDLRANKIVEGGIGANAFAKANIKTIQLNNEATDLATEAFAANSFYGIPSLATIIYSPAAANVKDHNFNLEAFWPEYKDVDIRFQTNKAVKDSYEQTGGTDLTPYRIKFILGIDVDLVKGVDGNYYGLWAPQQEMYVIDKYQQGTEVFVYSAYYDDKNINAKKVGDENYNKLYMNPLRVQDNGKYVINADEAVLIRVAKDIDLVAEQNFVEGTLEPKYKFGGIQTFAGLNVRQCNDLRYAPWYFYKAAVENNLEDSYGNTMSDYLIIRWTPNGSNGDKNLFHPAMSIPADYLYVLATNDKTLRSLYSRYDNNGTFENPWDNYNLSWIERYNEVLKAYGKLTSEVNTKDQMILDLQGKVADLEQQLADASGEEEIEDLNKQIEDLNKIITNLNACHEDDIDLMIALIDTRDAIRVAKEALELAGNNTAADVADVETVAAAQQALDDAKDLLADATAEMKKFTLGSIYLQMDAALPGVLAAAQPLKDYKAALKAWQEAHQAYLDKVNAEQNGENKTSTEVKGTFLPVKVLSNIDADGNEIPGFKGNTYYIKVTDEIKQILASKGFLTEVPVEEEADEDAAGARMLVDGEPASEPTETETTPFNLLSERVELYTKAEATETETDSELDPTVSARIVGLQGEAEEIGEFTATGIFVEVGEIVQPDGDYAFKSYGMKSNYDLWNELAEGEDATAPVQIAKTWKSPASGTVYSLFNGDDEKEYIWNPGRNGYQSLEDPGVMATKEITLTLAQRDKTLADFMKENSIAEAKMTLPEDDDDDVAGGIRYFLDPTQLTGGESNSSDETANPYADYLVWKDLENNSSNIQPLDEVQVPLARLAAPGDFNQYSDAIFEKDGKFYQIVEGETADSYKLVLIEEEASETPTNVWAAGSVKLVKNDDGTIADPINLGGKLYYPVTIVTNYQVDTTIDPETGEKTETVTETEIPGYTGKEDFFYVAADDVTKDGEIVESATGIRLLQKKEVEQTYPNPVEWTGIYVDLKATPDLEGDLAFRSFGEKYNSWDEGKDDVAFATGTVEIVKLLGEDDKPVVVEVEVEGESGDETKKQSNFVAAIETVEETKTEFVPADPESYTYTADDECAMCDAAEAVKEAAAALCEAANNLTSEDVDDPCADLKDQLDEAKDAYDAAFDKFGGYNIWPYKYAADAAKAAWSNAIAQNFDAAKEGKDPVYTEAQVAALEAAYNEKDAELLAYQGEMEGVAEELAIAKDIYETLLAAYNECKNPLINDYSEMSEEQLTTLMKELEIAIEHHLKWEDSNGDEYNPSGDTTVEKEALENYLHAKYGENCTPYDKENATPFIERVAVVPALQTALAEATDAAIKDKDATDIAEAELVLALAIVAHEAVQDQIEAKEDKHWAEENENESRYIPIIWNGENETVGIMESVVAKSGRTAEGEAAIYNLQGMKVKNAKKGVFIQNGVKVVK